MRGVPIYELRQEGEEEERRLRVQHVHDDPLLERSTEITLAAEGDLALRAPREERPEAKPDEVHGARELDRGERNRRRHDERGETGGRGRDVHEGADVDAEHRGEPNTPALVDRAGDDVEDGRARDEEQRERSDREQAEAGAVRDQRLSSQTCRKPCSVRNESTRSIVRECGATRSARPPVATAGASAPSSSRILATIPSTCPAKP